MDWPNLAIVLPLSLPLPSSRVFPSSCIINDPLILVRRKLRKCSPSEFTVPSCPYIHVHAIEQVSMSRERAEHFRPTYEASVLPCVLLGEGSVLPLRFALYETLQMCVL